MAEIDTSFSSLFGRVLDGGEGLGYTEKNVSCMVDGKQQVGYALESAVKGGGGPVNLRVFEPSPGPIPKHQQQDFRVVGVEIVKGGKAYAVVSSDDDQSSRVEFILTEGEFQRPASVSGEPKEVKYLSFCVYVEPVDESS